MKRKLLAGILGIASTSSLLAQSGHILISNYIVPPYNQVVWNNYAVNDPSAQIQIWYGIGVITDEASLQPGVVFGINPNITYDPGAGYGPGGYFEAQNQVIPGWTDGPVTFQLRGGFDESGSAAGPFGRTLLWTEQSTVVPTSYPANIATMVPAWVPEPSSFALAGVDLAAAFLCRRRKRVSSSPNRVDY